MVTSSDHPKKASLMGLPVELQTSILDYLTLNSDKKSFCLVSKRSQAVMVPLLYRNIEISAYRFLADPPSVPYGRVGLPHVRTLTIRHGISRWPHITLRIAKKVLDLIDELPEDSLSWFEIDYSFMAMSDIRDAARRRHKDIRNYQYRSHNHLTDDLESSGPQTNDNMARVTCLQLLVSSLHGLDPPHRLDHNMVWLLEHTHLLSRLEITCGYDSSSVLRALFELSIHSRNKHCPQPLQLQSLSLRYVAFKEAAFLLPNLVDFTSIKYLRLLDCLEIDSLFEILESLDLNITSLWIDGGTAIPWNDRLAMTVNNWMSSLKSIRTICLRISSPEAHDSIEFDLDWSRLHAFASAIECLELDIRNFGDEPSPRLRRYFDHAAAKMIQNKPSIHDFLRKAANLRQLSLTGFPVMTHDESDSWNLRSISSLKDILRHANNLRILRLFVCLDIVTAERDYYEHSDVKKAESITHDLAGAIFKAFPTLSAVIVRVCELECDYPSDCEHAYLRSGEVDLGGLRFEAVHTRLLKHHIAHEDFLDLKHTYDEDDE